MALTIKTDATDLHGKPCMTCGKRQARCVLHVGWEREEKDTKLRFSFGAQPQPLTIIANEFVDLPVCMACLAALETEIREKV